MIFLWFGINKSFPYPSGLPSWHWDNYIIAPEPVNLPLKIWVNGSHEATKNYITKTKHSTMVRWIYSMGHTPDSKVHGANMGPIWGWQAPDGSHVGTMNFAIWGLFLSVSNTIYIWIKTPILWATKDCPPSALSMSINPLRAKFFRENRNIYLHFVSFLHIDTTQVVEILPQIRQEPTYCT